MAVVWQASGTLLGSTGADITPVNPAHAADDILICQAASRNTAATCLTPASWTLLAGPTDSTNWRTYWFYIRATSGSTTNPLNDWSSATGDKYGVVHNVRGARTTGSPFDSSPVTAGTADPGIATGLTTSYANQRVFSFGMSGDNVATGFTALTSTDPTTYLPVHSYTTIATGADAGRWAASAVRTGIGATGTLSHDFNGAPLVWSILVASFLEPVAVMKPAMFNSPYRGRW